MKWWMKYRTWGLGKRNGISVCTQVRDYFLSLPQKYPFGHEVTALIDLMAERARAGLGPAGKVLVLRHTKSQPNDPLGRFQTLIT
jgi:hypothetical protein